jgi:hypothetical protein
MRKPKSNLQLILETRNEWTINPVTRVQENKKKDKKKRRQEDKKSCLYYIDKQDFFICGEVA